MMLRIPLWLHGMLRILLPLPCAVALTALYGWLCSLALSGNRLGGWVVFGCVILGIGIFAAGWLSPRWFMRVVRVNCTNCGQTADLDRKKGMAGDYFCDSCHRRFNSHWKTGNLVGGLVSAGMGLTGMILVLARNDVTLPVVAFLIGLVFFSLGVGLVGGRPLWNWLIIKMPWMKRIPWVQILGGGLALAVGVMFICIGLLSDESSMPSGRGAVVAAGAAFALAGVCILLPMIGQYVKVIPPRFILYSGTFLAICLLLAFAAVPTFIAIHDAGTEAAHPVPYISAAIIFALLGISTYVYFRDRKKKSSAD